MRKDPLVVAAMLPHRYPFLLVDRVVEIDPGQKILALKNVTVNEPFFIGHFPNHPIMPGVLICEAIAQAGGILIRASLSAEEVDASHGIAMLTALDHARFRHQVTPGDQLFLEVEALRRRGVFWKMRGVARVHDKIAAELEFTLAFESARVEEARE